MDRPISSSQEVGANHPQTFHAFPLLPAEVRSRIWTLALLFPSPWQTSQSLLETPLLHLLPFITLRRSASAEASLADADDYLTSRYGDDWQGSPLAERFRAEAADRCESLVVRYRASRTRLFSPPRGWSAGRGVKEQSSRVAASCEEAKRIWRRLTRRLGGLEGVVDLARDVVCFMPCKSSSHWGLDGYVHERLVPTLRREDAFRVEELDRRKRGAGPDTEIVRAWKEVVPGTVHSREIAVMWRPEMCPRMFFSLDAGLEPVCAAFKRDVIGLPNRHPKLEKIYLVDSGMDFRGLRVPKRLQPTFRGSGASFYEGAGAMAEDWTMTRPKPGQLHVFLWATHLERLFSHALWDSQPERKIHVRVMACVLDWESRVVNRIGA
ncbi:hypothetical protein MFIFM68171_07159 [Madurella fahalii]|uniref:Proteophosphoglycan ppg4 n=1 Tax=Madurella fahalii TaxID=1157608 RepID=A0ABQ0GGZ3_9PEZI